MRIYIYIYVCVCAYIYIMYIYITYIYMLHFYIYNAMLLLFYQVAESGKKHKSTIFCQKKRETLDVRLKQIPTFEKDLGPIRATKKNNSHQWTAYAEFLSNMTKHVVYWIYWLSLSNLHFCVCVCLCVQVCALQLFWFSICILVCLSIVLVLNI